MSPEDKPYVSSIVGKYGDLPEVRTDSKVLHEIIERQGMRILIDMIANYCGANAIHWNFNEAERAQLINNVTQEMREALAERL